MKRTSSSLLANQTNPTLNFSSQNADKNEYLKSLSARGQLFLLYTELSKLVELTGEEARIRNEIKRESKALRIEESSATCDRVYGGRNTNIWNGVFEVFVTVYVDNCINIMMALVKVVDSYRIFGKFRNYADIIVTLSHYSVNNFSCIFQNANNKLSI